MEEKLSVKENALEILDKQLSLRAKKNEYGVIVLSSATEPYLQFEPHYNLTRGILELILKYRFPVHVLTRSHLVVRDIDLLKQIDKSAILPDHLKDKTTRGVFVTFSFSTVEDSIARQFEPGATLPSVRLQTLKTILQEGFLSGVSMMPLLPYITDTTEQLHKSYSTFKEAGVRYLMPASITLFGSGPSDSKTLVMRVVEKYYPDILPKYQRFFSSADYLPAYYQQAFGKKMKELSIEYGIPRYIC
jgi:DNA repair photolyase